MRKQNTKVEQAIDIRDAIAYARFKEFFEQKQRQNSYKEVTNYKESEIKEVNNELHSLEPSRWRTCSYDATFKKGNKLYIVEIKNRICSAGEYSTWFIEEGKVKKLNRIKRLMKALYKVDVGILYFNCFWDGNTVCWDLNEKGTVDFSDVRSIYIDWLKDFPEKGGRYVNRIHLKPSEAFSISYNWEKIKENTVF